MPISRIPIRQMQNSPNDVISPNAHSLNADLPNADSLNAESLNADPLDAESLNDDSPNFWQKPIRLMRILL